ncbi:MAG: DUF4242 domain-containing protein [Actinomycetes bacterium]
MRTYIIERTIPGASGLSGDDLRGIATTSNGVVDGLGVPYEWDHSYVAGDRIICVHRAENEEAVREHARRGNFPVDSVTEVAAVFGPETAGA